MPGIIEAPAEVSRIVPPSRLLQEKLAGLRRKHLSVALLSGACITLAVSLELLGLAMFLDWWLDLPRSVRALLLVGQILVFGFFLYRTILVPLLRQPNEDELALMVERACPQFQTRLISSVQLTRPGAIPEGSSPGIVDAMVEQTEAVAAPVDFGGIVSTDRLKKFAMVAACVLMLALLALLVGGGSIVTLLKRALLSNVAVPRKTRVLVIDGDRLIGRGDSIRLEAFAQGIVPGHGKLEITHPGRRKQEFNLEQDREDKARFGRTLENVQDSFSYTITLNDGISGRHDITAVPRPTISRIECLQEFPAYTQLKPTKRALGDLSLLAGSRIHLQGAATKPLRAAALRTAGAPVEFLMPSIASFPPTVSFVPVLTQILPLDLAPTNSANFSGSIRVPAKGLSGFSVLMVDSEGMESRDAAVYRIDTIPDKAPTVRLLYPDRKEELVTRHAVMLLSFEASDDFAVAKVRLHYRVDDLDEGAEKYTELNLEEQLPPRLRRRYDWKLAQAIPGLREGSRIEFWIEAQDNNDATGPGITPTEHQFAKVVSEAEKRADLLNRAGDYLGSITDVASDQEKLNTTLGTIIREKTGF